MSKRKNLFQIDERFVHYGAELLNSPALRALSPLATKELHAYEAALMEQRNGELKVSRDQLMEWMD